MAPTTAGVYVLNQDWLFGAQYVAGTEAPGYSESGFDGDSAPRGHASVVGGLESNFWNKLWTYRRHIPQSVATGGRVLVHFDGVVSPPPRTSTALNSGSTKGVLPFSVELTAGLTEDDNVLALVVDATWQQVLPDEASFTPTASPPLARDAPSTSAGEAARRPRTPPSNKPGRGSDGFVQERTQDGSDGVPGLRLQVGVPTREHRCVK